MNTAHPRNPFKPTFGISPPLLVARDEMIHDFSDALEDGPGAPGLREYLREHAAIEHVAE